MTPAAATTAAEAPICRRRPICRRCLSWDVAPGEASGRARLYTYTVTTTPFHPYWADKVPYVVAIAELDEQPGLRLITNVVDCDEGDLTVGLPLRVTFREVAPGLVLPLFVPAVA